MAVYNVCSRLEHGEIDLAPDFQRKAGLWDDEAQSRLIESLIIRIPLPAFYLEEVSEDQYAVIDGVQRLNALKRFCVRKELRLTNLEFMPDYEGQTFDQLPPPVQRRINETQLLITMVEPGTPSNAKLNIFKRINTRGLVLSAQEIRHAMNPGAVRDFLREAAEGKPFQDATDGGAKSDRMADREMVARFFAFKNLGLDAYKNAEDFDTFINSAMAHLNTLTAAERERERSSFDRAMRATSSVLGNYAFRRVVNGRRSPINKALFDAISLVMHELSDQQHEILRQRKLETQAAYFALFADNAFEASVTFATADLSKVEYRFSTVRDLFGKLVQ